jgi:gliding motility-associatede transport system auxiliary component
VTEERTTSRRETVERRTLLVSVLPVLALLAIVNWLGFRHWARGDWTHAQIYSLSPTTKKVLASLKEPVQVTVFMNRNTPLYSQVSELLNRYRSASKEISVETLDPRRNPARAEQLVKDFGIRDQTVVFVSGSRKKYVEQDKLADYDYSGAQMGRPPKIKAFKGEEAFTSAIVAVTSSKSPKIYVTSGHGEKAIDAFDRGSGFSDAKDLLEKDNDTVATWNALGQGVVPKDADLVLVPGPRTAWLAPEAGALDQYLAAGGRVLLMIDPVLPGAGSPKPDLGFSDFFADWGIQAQNDIVVDPGNALPLVGAETVFINHFGAHDIVRPLETARMAVIFPLARSIDNSTPKHAGYAGTRLLETTASGWGETDLVHLDAVRKDDKDVKGPVGLGVAVSASSSAAASGPGSKEAGKARLVVYGDSDFAGNGELGNAGNADLFLNTVHWLVGSEELVGIKPKTPEQSTLTLSAAQVRRIGILSILLIPGLAVGLGIFVYFRRRD